MADDEKKAAREPTPTELKAWDLVRHGMTSRAAGRQLGVSHVTVLTHIETVKAWLGEDPLLKAAKDDVEGLAPKAVTAYKEIIDDSSATAINARLSAARDILKSAGILKEPPKKVEGDLNLTVNEQVRKQIANLATAIGVDGDDLSE